MKCKLIVEHRHKSLMFFHDVVESKPFEAGPSCEGNVFVKELLASDGTERDDRHDGRDRRSKQVVLHEEKLIVAISKLTKYFSSIYNLSASCERLRNVRTLLRPAGSSIFMAINPRKGSVFCCKDQS